MPALMWPNGLSDIPASPDTSFAPATARQLESLLTVESLNPLVIDAMAVGEQDRMDSAVAEAWSSRGD
jgi:hypothetical protein